MVPVEQIRGEHVSQTMFYLKIKDPAAGFANARTLLQQHAGDVKGDLDSGIFFGRYGLNMVEGSYKALQDNNYEFTITHKPMLIGLDEIEQKIREYFGA